MKTLFYLTLCYLLCSNFNVVKAQSIEDAALLAAKGLCGCVKESYSNIDSDVKRAMIRIIRYQKDGKQAEMEQYVQSLSADLASRIESQALLFQENNDLFELCIEDMEEAMAQLNLNEEAYNSITEEEFVQYMMEEMKTLKGCKFTYLLMELGLEELANNQMEQDGKTTEHQKDERHSKYEGTGGN